jgi:regulator of sigma E protease
MMHLLAIDWSTVGVKAAQLILSLSILVVLHEFGHYITARWFGCRVEKFYLFFDPWFSLLKKKVGDTEYGVGWLPLGGYVKIAGMMDESMDKEAMALPPKEWEFRSKPAWQRLIIMLGGIIVNVLLGIFIYSLVLFAWGEQKTPMNSLKNGISFQDSIFYKIGFQKGDQLMQVDNKPVLFLEDAALQVLTGKNAQLLRNGNTVNVNFPVDIIGHMVEKKSKIRLEPRLPAIIGSFDGIDKSAAKNAGIQEGDIVVAIDSIPLQYFDEIGTILKASKDDSVNVSISRNGVPFEISCALMDDKKLGIPSLSDLKKLESLGVLRIEEKHYSFLEAFPAGFALTVEQLKKYIDQFRLILNPETGAYKGLGGFKAIANAFPGMWDWESFWRMTAFLSIVLAFMNLLPIPALDGGHVMFTLYEMISGRKPNEKLLEYAQVAGMVFLLILMLYANGNDWFGWGR